MLAEDLGGIGIVEAGKSHTFGDVADDLPGGAPADTASTHRIGLPGERERPHAGTADPPGQEMTIDDGIDLVDAAGGLVDPLRIERDRALGLDEPVEEFFDRALRETADIGGF